MMSATHGEISLGPPRDDAEVNEFMRIVAQALFFPTIDHQAFVKREGRENVTVARYNDSVAGGLIVQPSGMSFGGRSVNMDAVRTVAVAPEFRSKGIGVALMDGVVRDSFTKGVSLSALYPATLPVYRRAGYELAGSRTTYRYAIGTIGKFKRTLPVREATDADRPILNRLYKERFSRSPGNIDRNEWAWQRVLDPPTWWPRTYGYIVEDDGEPAGYLYFGHKPGGNITDNTVAIADVMWRSAEAGRSLLAMLADHRSVVIAVEFAGAPADPLSLLMDEGEIESITRFDWMIRIVNVKKAIEQRGYPRGVRGELHLDVTDPTISQNCGKHVVTIAEGRATVSKGGDGRLSANIRDLAPLYSGHMSAESLRAVNRLDADDESIEMASSIFAGSAPWMSDMF